MRRNSFYIGVIFLLLIITAATPISVRAEGDPPTTPEPVQAPWITGRNPQVSLTINEDEELSPAGAALQRQSIAVQLMAPPSYVELESQSAGNPAMDGMTLAVPQIYQKPEDVTCGAAALGMALEFLSLNGEGEAPSQAALVTDLKNSGLLYETGTGVEELAYMARQHGYQGTTAFHDWSLEQLAQQLAAGRPVVVSLGSNGDNQPGHFVTLTGISADGKWVSYNDPTLGKQTVPAADFMKSWNLQGNSGLSVQKEPLSAMNDPMLPWMGLFSAMAMLAVMAKQVPLGGEIAGTLTDIRKLLSNPSRKGLGGKLEVGGAGGSSSPPYSAPHGYKWIQKSVPKYGWKNITTTHSRQVPIFEKKKVQVDTEVSYVNVPRYRTVRVDRGSWVNKKVTLYRRTKYVRYYRTSRVRKTRWVRRGWRLVPQTYYVTKRTPVYGYKSVPYRTYYKKEWKSNWVTEKQLDGYTKVRHEKPVYEHLMMPTGKTKTEYYTKTEKRWGVIGTELEWKLEKNPTPTLSNPMATSPSWPTSTPSATSWPSSTPSATPSPTSTPAPSATPTSQYDWIYTGTQVPEPTGTPVPPEDWLTESGFEGKWVGKVYKYVKKARDMITASSIMYKTLESGQISISAPTIPIGDKRTFLDGFDLFGTKFNPSTITDVTGKYQISKALSKSTWITAALTSLVGNVIDYGVGKNKDKGLGQEFAVSTAVDTVMSVGIGLLATGAVVGVATLIGATLTVPAAIAATAVAGLAIGGILDAGGVNTFIKDKANNAVDAIEVEAKELAKDVSNGFEAWKGVIDNAKIVGSHVGDTIAATVENVSSTVTNTVNESINTIGTTISNTAARVNNAIEETISNTVDSIGNFLGNVFSGGE